MADNTPAAYRLRMRFLQWYLDIENAAGQVIERDGPYLTQAAATEAARLTGLRDADAGPT